MKDYPAQLAAKETRLRALLAPFFAGELAVYPSPPQHYRLRAEFRIWHEGEAAHYAMMPPRGTAVNRETVRFITEFPPASERINARMRSVQTALVAHPELRHKLYEVDFLDTLRGDDLITFIYHRPLDEAWQRQMAPLAAAWGCSVIGRSRRQKCVIGRDFVSETLQVDGQRYHYRQYENTFSQPNGQVCEAMLAWVCAHNHHQGELLELYCGHGNFSLPLARHCQKLWASEVSKKSVQALMENCAANGIDNLEVWRLAAETLRAQWDERYGLGRAIEGVLVDPPRAGIDAETLAFLARFPQITYISCNPETLCRDLQQLTRSHALVAAALFDQFPYTDHIEAGVILKKLAAPEACV